MNRIQLLSKSLVIGFFFLGTCVYGQKQTKTYKENFKVTEDAVLDINTSHADIAFETWNKDEILVEATITLEGVTKAEAEDYFKNVPLEIMGNSRKVSISTHAENTWSFAHNWKGFDNFDFQFEFPDMPELMDMDSLAFDMDMTSELHSLLESPPMPPMPPAEFDYDAFKKDGKEYLQKWQKEFSKGFNKDYERKLQEWGDRMEAKRKASEEHRESLLEHRQENRERLFEQREKLLESRDALREKQREALQSRTKAVARLRTAPSVIVDSTNYLFILNDSIGTAPNIFYFSPDGENKNYKVKKTIMIKLPKSIKIKMNVRHGEVKLAENTKNLDATLSYASLFAATIDGDLTNINASYSPVSVLRWNYGQLQANYSDHINLKEVLNLKLNATSSAVVIDNVLKTVFIKNDLGPLRIKSVSKDFKALDISLKNAEFDCQLPTSAYNLYVSGTSSKFASPSALTLEKTSNLNSQIHRGYHLNKNNDRSITINSEYSKVVLQ